MKTQTVLRFAAAHLHHPHIFDMCHHLVDASAELVSVYDEDAARIEAFLRQFPSATVTSSDDDVLGDPTIDLVASAHVPSSRGAFGCRVQAAGKHYFSDKAPFTTLQQIEKARLSVARTRRRWFVCYGERVQSEAAVLTEQLVAQGRIGRIVQIVGLAPHRLRPSSRPPWFFEREKYGGIICDLGSHHVEQFLSLTSAHAAEVLQSTVANYANPSYPELEDFGDFTLLTDDGVAGHFRVDWLTPDGLSTWGDGRTFVLGTEGFIELRKYVDVARSSAVENIYLVDREGEHYINAKGKTGLPYFAALIQDVLTGSNEAMDQDHTFRAAEISIRAQELARRVALPG